MIVVFEVPQKGENVQFQVHDGQPHCCTGNSAKHDQPRRGVEHQQKRYFSCPLRKFRLGVEMRSKGWEQSQLNVQQESGIDKTLGLPVLIDFAGRIHK